MQEEGPMTIEGSAKKLWDKISRLDFKRKIAVLLLVTVLVYGTGITIDAMYLSKDVAPELSHPDIPRYQARTQTIIDGGLLYRDVHTETPPIINYLMVPAQLLGGADNIYVYSAYFSMFSFLLALMFYLVFRKTDETRAFAASLMVLFSPFLFCESSLGEDESIMAFVFMGAAILMLYDHKRWSAVAIAMGIWTKMFPLLLLPTEFLRQRKLKDKAVLVGIVVLITVLVTGAFIVLCYDDFTYFLNFYFLGDSNRPTGGQSMWHFLDQGGIEIPRLVELGIVGAGMVFTYLFCHIKKLGVWESVTLAMLAFFVLYPKVHTGYYAILFALLAVWAVDNKKVAVRIFLSFIPIIASVAFADLESGETYIEFEGSWLIGLSLNLIGTLLLVDATRLALKSKPFIYAGKETLHEEAP